MVEYRKLRYSAAVANHSGTLIATLVNGSEAVPFRIKTLLKLTLLWWDT